MTDRRLREALMRLPRYRPIYDTRTGLDRMTTTEDGTWVHLEDLNAILAAPEPIEAEARADTGELARPECERWHPTEEQMTSLLGATYESGLGMARRADTGELARPDALREDVLRWTLAQYEVTYDHSQVVIDTDHVTAAAIIARRYRELDREHPAALTAQHTEDEA